MRTRKMNYTEVSVSEKEKQSKEARTKKRKADEVVMDVEADVEQSHGAVIKNNTSAPEEENKSSEKEKQDNEAVIEKNASAPEEENKSSEKEKQDNSKAHRHRYDDETKAKNRNKYFVLPPGPDSSLHAQVRKRYENLSYSIHMKACDGKAHDEHEREELPEGHVGLLVGDKLRKKSTSGNVPPEDTIMDFDRNFVWVRTNQKNLSTAINLNNLSNYNRKFSNANVSDQWETLPEDPAKFWCRRDPQKTRCLVEELEIKGSTEKLERVILGRHADEKWIRIQNHCLPLEGKPILFKLPAYNSIGEGSNVGKCPMCNKQINCKGMQDMLDIMTRTCTIKGSIRKAKDTGINETSKNKTNTIYNGALRNALERHCETNKHEYFHGLLDWKGGEWLDSDWTVGMQVQCHLYKAFEMEWRLGQDKIQGIDIKCFQYIMEKKDETRLKFALMQLTAHAMGSMEIPVVRKAITGNKLYRKKLLEMRSKWKDADLKAAVDVALTKFSENCREIVMEVHNLVQSFDFVHYVTEELPEQQAVFLAWNEICSFFRRGMFSTVCIPPIAVLSEQCWKEMINKGILGMIEKELAEKYSTNEQTSAEV